MPLLRGWVTDKSNQAKKANLSLSVQRDVKQETKPVVKKTNSSDSKTAATRVTPFMIVFAIIAVLGLVCAVLANRTPELFTKGLDGACSPVRPGVVIDASSYSDSGEFGAPWWVVPGQMKGGVFGLFCGSRRRSQLAWNTDNKKKLRLTFTDADTDETLLSKQGLFAARILPSKIEIQKTPGNLEEVEGPWSLNL